MRTLRQVADLEQMDGVSLVEKGHKPVEPNLFLTKNPMKRTPLLVLQRIKRYRIYQPRDLGWELRPPNPEIRQAD